MSLEKFENNELPVENASGERLETADAVEARLGQLGWTSEQIGNFASAIRMMADAMTRDGADGHAGNVSIELNVADSEETGVEEAEVTLMGEGKELGPDRLSELVSDTEFFVNMNKVVLRRKKDRTSDGYRSIKEGPHHEV